MLRSNVQSGKNALAICAIRKKRFESKVREHTRPVHSFLPEIKKCFGSNVVVDRDSRICSTCRAAMSTPKKTGETFEHVSAHFYFSKTYTMKKKNAKQTFRSYCRVFQGNKNRYYILLRMVGSRNLSRGRPQKRAPPSKPATKKFYRLHVNC